MISEGLWRVFCCGNVFNLFFNLTTNYMLKLSKLLFAVLLVSFISIDSTAGTTTCANRSGLWTFKQWRPDGGAAPDPERTRPHWFLNNVESFS